MTTLSLHEFHAGLGARFTEVNGVELVAHYADWLAEHSALTGAAGVLDLSARTRLCLTGADGAKFLHGQVTNDVAGLAPGAGCYAALVSTKGRMQADLHIWRLAEELLLDAEPGLTAAIAERLEKYIVSDDVQVVDAAPHYGLLSVQGPRAAEAVRALGLSCEIPAQPNRSASAEDPALGQVYLMNHPRLGTSGFDLFVPDAALAIVAEKLVDAARALRGCACGWDAMEAARIEAGIPRFGADMDETNLPPEAGIEARAMSYQKGCYIGQEVLNRLKVMGHVSRALRGLRLAETATALPKKGDKLVNDGKEVGFVTSAVRSPALQADIALAYVRREHHSPGTELTLKTSSGESTVRVAELPFTR